MSFSRWSHSRWYTYWSGGEDNKRDNQIFQICACCHFTYKELVDDIEKCLVKVKEMEQRVYDSISEGPYGFTELPTYKIEPSLEPSQEELEELRGYMNKFIERIKKDTTLEDRI